MVWSHSGTNLIAHTKLTHRAGLSKATQPLNIDEENGDIDGLANHGGWVNPEDLMPMPQCIAQQDPSIWLDAMTKCTRKICINHVGPLICTRHQWLTQLSCLSLEMSPDVIRNYLPQCGRSILGKAQLYSWVHETTGRTWLVDAGDTTELRYLSPASLLAGYASVRVIQKAPTCLASSAAIPSQEPFQHVIASCSFKDTSYHTGNEARPWEYRESSGSIVALDWTTVGYDLTRKNIPAGDYFDKKCFCNIFAADFDQAACSAYDTLDLTRQRLWISATCGSSLLPPDWKTTLKTTRFDYIPVESWNWPKCFTDMPGYVTDRADQCVTDACQVGSDGYCNIKRAVDRSCFCRAINYDSCKGSCHIFESRIDYIQWLHNLCGNVHGWHGLPEDWRQLAAPMISDLVPFPWTSRRKQPSTDIPPFSSSLKLITLILLNVTPFLAILLSEKFDRWLSKGASQSRTSPVMLPLNSGPRNSNHESIAGICVAAVNSLAIILNIVVAQSIPGFEEVPFYELTLLWCSMPRLSWLASIFVMIKQPAIDTESISATLVMEWIYQVFASLTMLQAVQYGFAHDFFSENMEKLDDHTPAKTMYLGSLIWTVASVLALLYLVYTMFKSAQTASVQSNTSYPQHGKTFTAKTGKKVRLAFNEQRRQGSHTSEHTGLFSGSSAMYDTSYGSISTSTPGDCSLEDTPVRFFYISIGAFIVLWLAQCLFWGGFLELTSDF